MLRPAEPAPAAAPAASSSTSGSLCASAATALALGGLAFVTLFDPSTSRIQTWPLSALVAALWLLPVVVLLTALFLAPPWRKPPPLIFGGVLLLTIATFSSAAASPFAPASLPRIWPTVGGMSLYLLLHHAWSAPDTSPVRLTGAARLLGFAGVVVCGVSLVQWSHGAWPLPWGVRNTAPFGHSIYTAGAAVLVMPWIVLQVWMARGAQRWGWAVGLIAAIAVLIGTSSRGGVLALVATGAGMVGLVLLRSTWSRQRKILLVLIVSLAGLVVVFTNQRLRDLVVNRQWAEIARESNDQRRAMLHAGMKLGSERVLLGWGPGTVPIAYPHVRADLDGGTENILQLHNTPAQIFATTGTVGLLGMLALVLGGAMVALRAPRTPIALTATASLFGYGLFALTDHQLDVPFFATIAAAGLALLTASSASGAEASLPKAWRLTLGITIAAGVCLALRPTFCDLLARQRYDTALTALGKNNPDAYVRALDEATAATPHDPFFDHQAAAFLLEQRHATRDRAQQTALTNDAIRRLRRSLATGVHQEYAHFNLGWLLLDLTQPAEAARHFTAAARLVPDKGGVYFGLGLAYHGAGKHDAALRCFALEIVNDPRQLTSPAWELPTLAVLLPEVRQEVGRLYDELRTSVPQAAAIAVWTRWWWGESVPVTALRPGFNATSARFAAALDAISRREDIPPSFDPWARAYVAWRNAGPGGAAGDARSFSAVAGADREFASALARRAARPPPDFRRFLSDPVGDEAALLVTLRRQRIGYGVLALHPEGPPIADLFVVQENRVVSELATGLFPSKGWIPGRFLLRLLPDAP